MHSSTLSIAVMSIELVSTEVVRIETRRYICLGKEQHSKAAAYGAVECPHQTHLFAQLFQEMSTTKDLSKLRALMWAMMRGNNVIPQWMVSVAGILMRRRSIYDTKHMSPRGVPLIEGQSSMSRR